MIAKITWPKGHYATLADETSDWVVTTGVNGWMDARLGFSLNQFYYHYLAHAGPSDGNPVIAASRNLASHFGGEIEVFLQPKPASPNEEELIH